MKEPIAGLVSLSFLSSLFSLLSLFSLVLNCDLKMTIQEQTKKKKGLKNGYNIFFCLLLSLSLLPFLSTTLFISHCYYTHTHTHT